MDLEMPPSETRKPARQSLRFSAIGASNLKGSNYDENGTGELSVDAATVRDLVHGLEHERSQKKKYAILGSIAAALLVVNAVSVFALVDHVVEASKETHVSGEKKLINKDGDVIETADATVTLDFKEFVPDAIDLGMGMLAPRFATVRYSEEASDELKTATFPIASSFLSGEDNENSFNGQTTLTVYSQIGTYQTCGANTMCSISLSYDVNDDEVVLGGCDGCTVDAATITVCELCLKNKLECAAAGAFDDIGARRALNEIEELEAEGHRRLCAICFNENGH